MVLINLMQLTQDSFHASQAAISLIDIDNSDSELHIERINSKLYCSIRLKDNSTSTHFTKEILIDSLFPVRIRAKSSLLNVSPNEIILDLPSVNQLESMFTTKGNLLDYLYTHEVEAQINSNCICCGSLPKVKLFIT